jgi:hypothetical protein
LSGPAPLHALIILGDTSSTERDAANQSVSYLQRMLAQIGARRPSRYLNNEISYIVLRQIEVTFAEARKKAANVVIFFLGHGNKSGDWILKDRALSVREIIGIWSASAAARLAIVSDCCYAGKQINCLFDSDRSDVCLLMSSAPDEVSSVSGFLSCVDPLF